MALAKFRKYTGATPSSGRFVVGEGTTGCNYIYYQDAILNAEVTPAMLQFTPTDEINPV